MTKYFYILQFIFFKSIFYNNKLQYTQCYLKMINVKTITNCLYIMTKYLNIFIYYKSNNRDFTQRKK